MTYKTIAEIVKANKEAGQYFFSPDTMAFWGSKVETKVIEGCYFVTSEDYYDRSRKVFNVRKALQNGVIVTAPWSAAPDYGDADLELDTLDEAIAMAYLRAEQDRLVERNALLQENIKKLETEIVEFATEVARQGRLSKESRTKFAFAYSEMQKTLQEIYATAEIQ